MSETKRGNMAFELPQWKGLKMCATYLLEPDGNALIEITKDGVPLRQFLYPAYKIWNLAAHWVEIAESELAGDDDGYREAGSDLLGGTVMPREVKSE